MQQQKTAPLFTNHQLLTLLWPLVIEQALEVLVGMADTMMVSSAGEAAISGVSLVDMINQLIITIFGALATGGAVVTSQYLGAKKPGDAARSDGHQGLGLYGARTVAEAHGGRLTLENTGHGARATLAVQAACAGNA